MSVNGRKRVMGLQKSMDTHSDFHYVKFLRSGVDGHFDARRAPLDAPHDYEYVDPSKYWKQGADLDIGQITCPADSWAVAIYSKNVFPNGKVVARITWPDLTKDGQSCWFGFENGSAGGTGTLAFSYRQESGVEKMYVVMSGGFSGYGTDTLEITNLLPSDYKTTDHEYAVIVSKNITEWYIDDALVALAVMSPNIGFSSISGPPYALGNAHYASNHLVTLLEPAGHGEELTLDIAPYQFRVSGGDPIKPRTYRLYDAGTNDLFAGLSIAAGSETSHPFPLFGYGGKTVHFRADGAGTLDVEVLTQTNNWRTYDSITIAANTLKSYNLAGEGVLARITFTPDAYPTTITEAEAVLR